MKAMNVLSGMLIGFLLAAFCFLVSSKAAPAQDPAKVEPGAFKVLLDNDRVRVADFRLKPGQKEPMHSHPFGAVVYYFTDAKTRSTLPDGRVTEDSRKAGEVLWRDPLSHAGENIGTAELHALIIEPKTAANAR
jgi:quercetin dioxygenase-like cupin family protein